MSLQWGGAQDVKGQAGGGAGAGPEGWREQLAPGLGGKSVVASEWSGTGEGVHLWRRGAEEGRGRTDTYLRMDRETFCFQGLSLRMPMPKPERKNSSPVVTRSHFCEASNSSTAESQMKACSLLPAEAGSRGPWSCRPGRPTPAPSGVPGPDALLPGGGRPPPPRTCPAPPGWPPAPHLSLTAWMASAALS